MGDDVAFEDLQDVEYFGHWGEAGGQLWEHWEDDDVALH